MASLRLKRGLEANRGNITPLEGELIATTDTKKVYLGDGTTAGGIQVGGGSIIENGTSNVTVPTANGNVTVNAGTTKSWTFDTTGNLTIPANAVVKSTTGNVTIEANQIIQGLRVNGESDVTALPSISQTGWYFNNQWNAQTVTPGLWTNGGATTDSLDVYFIVPTSATSGSNIVAIDTLGLESLQNGPLTWDSANAALLVGQGISVFDLDFVSSIPSSTIFAAGARITAVDVAGGNITISSNALKSSTNFAIDAGTLISDPTHGFYQLVGDTAVAGTIDFWDPPILTTATGQLTGWAGPFTGNTTAGSALTYTPSKTWSTYPELRDAATPGGLRAIDVNNVPGSVMSFTRYNNPIVIGADSTGNAAGYPTTTGRADQALTLQGVTMINTNLDTRRNGDISTGNTTGTIPKMALNFITYETADSNANANVARQTREKQGSVISTTEAAGNILTDNANLYVRGNVSLGSIRWGAIAGTTGPSTANPNPVAPQAGMYIRAETDFSATTNTPTGVYLQYTPADQGVGYPRTFLRAVNNTTTINGTSVSLKPLANKAPITVQSGSAVTETLRRNYLRELNATQDQVFLNASYYSGGNANAQGSGTTVQVRSDARIGNVALQLGRNSISSMSAAWVSQNRTTLGQYISNGGNYYEATASNTTGTNFFRLGTSAPTHTTGNVLNGNVYLVYVGNSSVEGAATYEFIVKEAETALTLYDKLNTTNIATFTNSTTTVKGNLVVDGTINGYIRTFGQFEYNTTVTPVAADTAYVFPLGSAALSSVATVGSTSRLIPGSVGKFNLQFSVQVANADNQEHVAYIWLVKNGTAVTNSTGRVTVIKSGSLIVGWNYLVETANNTDYFEIGYAVSNTNLTFPTYASTAFAPSTATLITTLTPVGA